MVKRIYVEKKEPFEVEAKHLWEELSGGLSLERLTAVRVINRYDVEGVDEETYRQARQTVFSEPAIDLIYDEKLPEDIGENFFAVWYLPGQYDQRADSAAQCIKMINPAAQPLVRFARVIALSGELTEQEMDAVKRYCINPVDSEEAPLAKPDRLTMETTVPQDTARVENFTRFSPEELEQFRQMSGFAMSAEDIRFVQRYFADTEGRAPTECELRVIDTYWSDHCRHTTFLTRLTDIRFEEDGAEKAAFDEYLEMRREVYGETPRDISLMDLACIAAKYFKKKDMLEGLDESEEINACSIKVKAKVNGQDEDWLVLFKNETHNHPTEIEPFGGAATCLGGAIRDPLSGRAFVYQAMRVTGAADPRRSAFDTLPGKLPQRKITQEAAAGYSSYGNQIGLATGQVTEIYDEGYMAKRMEVGAVIGAAPAAQVRRERPVPGDVVILVGGRTGRDGCGGATGSSKEHTEDSISECSAEVQKGNPPVERNIQRLFRRSEVTGLIKKCNDFGAGGVSVAIGELADGLEVNLDLVPKKYEGLSGTELAISESQERMAVVVSAADETKFIAFAREENLEATAVAKVTDTGRFRMFWRGDLILDLSREFLDTNGASQEAQVLVGKGKAPEQVKVESPADLLGDLSCCSQKGLVERFDSTIGAGTLLMPLGGKHQLSPAVGMAAKLPVLSGDTETATLMAYGFDPKISTASPFHGAMYAVVESVTKIAAMGGDVSKVWLSFQEYFERMTENPAVWGKPFAALLGALKAQRELGIAAIGGKDSMSGTFMDIHVPPTLISFAVTACDADKILSTEFKRAGSRIILLSAGLLPDRTVNFTQYKRNMERVHALASQGKILAANTIGRGGVFVALTKMAAGNHIGFVIGELSRQQLCEPDPGALLLEIDQGENIEALFEGLPVQMLGDTADSGELIVQDVLSMKLEEALERWQAPLERIFPVRTVDFRVTRDKTPVSAFDYELRNTKLPALRMAVPRVVIPVFPGTNCEADSMRAFRRAGAEVSLHIMQSLTQNELLDSIRELAEKIKKSQIVMIPGGFSGGDEPDGSAKFITAVFRNERVREAVAELLENRDGLMLGICNGFQALIKLGLVPYGKIVEPDASNPTLTYNKIGRHRSGFVRTRVASAKSPWLAGCQVGDIHMLPVSHGEGRFIASGDSIRGLMENGQVAMQYVDLSGRPSMDIDHNPNYSAEGIEAITSPDGRILGKMAHSERIGRHLYGNIEGEKDQRIFESGVKYFCE